jgi:hypothetical protein
MVVGVWKIVLALQDDSDGCGVEWNCLVRLLLHLLIYTVWYYFDPSCGSVAVDWAWPVRRSMSDPGEIEVWHERLADKLHACSVLLMAFLKVDSSLIWDPTMNFILGLLHCGNQEVGKI